MGASRLPGKVLLDINGQTLLEHVIDKLKKSRYIDRIIVATTTDILDDELVKYCEQKNMLCYRGDVNNVLDRFIKAGEQFQCDKIIRVCADNPFIDTRLIDEQLKVFVDDESLEYCTYATADDMPVMLKPLGVFVEAVTMKALRRVAAQADDPKYFEHVTMFIYQHPEFFKIKLMPLDSEINSNYRFTVDYPEDIAFCAAVMKATNDYSFESLIKLMENNGGLREKNLSFSRAHEKKY